MANQHSKGSPGEQAPRLKKKVAVPPSAKTTGLDNVIKGSGSTERRPPLVHSPPHRSQGPPAPTQATTSATSGKVPIPRLKGVADPASSGGSPKVADKKVNHACQPCRHRKTKCSGRRPVCQHCEDFNITCVYEDGKRSREKREFGQMASKIEMYEQLLQEASCLGDASLQARILRALESVSIDFSSSFALSESVEDAGSDEDEVKSGASSSKVSVDQSGSPGGELQPSGRAGSTGSLDRIREDFDRTTTTRATGFHGKSSEVAWMQRLRDQTVEAGGAGSAGLRGRQTGRSPAEEGQRANVPMQTTSGSTYHCDDFNLLALDQIDRFELPRRHIAELLLGDYWETVHPTFPIISKLKFTDQFRQFCDDSAPRLHPKWLAILNVIFAIGAKFSHLVQAEFRGDERDHSIYFARARLLAFDGDGIFAQPDLQLVQVTGLMGFYLMSTNSINRSWTLCGIALRYSVALGLHLRNDSGSLSLADKEARYRLWWALYGLERLLGVMTCRPTAIVDSGCITPLPLPIEEDLLDDPTCASRNADLIRMMRHPSCQGSPHPTAGSSSTVSPRAKSPIASTSSETPPHIGLSLPKDLPGSWSLCFVKQSQLNMHAHEILTQLYRPSITDKSWLLVQTVISLLDSKLEKWRSELPPFFEFAKRPGEDRFPRQRLSLALMYYSFKMIVHRPCLCQMDRSFRHASGASREFNRNAAAVCVQAARRTLDSIPDEPNTVGLYHIAPWWCLTHYLMQAATVLMLELFFRAEHMPEDADEILGSAKKAVYWLHHMSRDSIAAQRAWQQCDTMLRRVAPRIGRNADDLRSKHALFASSRIGTHLWAPSSGDGHRRVRGASPVEQQVSGPLDETEMVFAPSQYSLYDEYLLDGVLMPRVGFDASDVSSMFPTSSQIEAWPEASPLTTHPTDDATAHWELGDE